MRLINPHNIQAKVASKLEFWVNNIYFWQYFQRLRNKLYSSLFADNYYHWRVERLIRFGLLCQLV